MKQVFKYVIKRPNEVQKEILKDLMWHVTKVYNIMLYSIIEDQTDIPDRIEKEALNILSSDYYREYKRNNWHSKYLHSHTLQQVIINVLQNYKAYVKAKKEYDKRPNKFKGKPKLPRYKTKENQEVVFTKYAIRIQGNTLRLSLSKEMKEKYQVESLNFLIPRKLKKLVKIENIKMIKIKTKEKSYVLEIIYEREISLSKENKTNIMAIDLGLDNIVACTNKENTKTLLVSGKSVKSLNVRINDKISKLQKLEMLRLKNSKAYINTKRIKKLYEKRRNYINTYMHKVSKMVIEYAKENNCKEIVIGDLKDIKQGMKNNTKFIQIPLKSLRDKIEYKAKLNNIEVKYITEEYTSGVSAIDKEEIKKENYNIKRRITRGIFVTKEGKKINADINGSLNILRKYIKKSSPNEEIPMDKGREQRPIKKNVA